MSIHLSEVIAAMINFVIFFIFMKVYFFKKIEAVIVKRNLVIKENMDKARIAQDEAEKILLISKQEADRSKDTGRQILKEYKGKAETLYEEIIDEARTEGRTIINRAELEAERERENARKEIREEVINLSTLLSRKVLSQEVSQEAHEKLVDDIISKVGV